jgi:signal transduction histidine kinase
LPRFLKAANDRIFGVSSFLSRKIKRFSSWLPYSAAIPLVFILTCTGFAAEQTGSESKTITRAADILDLSREEAKKEYPIHLLGVVTCFDQATRLCFLYDGQASVYVYTTTPIELAAGDFVDLKGVTGSGLYSPIAQQVVVTRIGRTNLPPAKLVTIDQLASGREDCQFVQLEGTVQKEWNAEDDNHYLRIGPGGSGLEICLAHARSAHQSYLDCKVRVRGVSVARRNDRLKTIDTQLFVPAPDQIEILEPGSADPFKLPVLHGRDISSYSHQGRSEHRVHLRGTVTSPPRGDTLFIRDEAGPVRVELSQTNSGLRAGEIVDCAGFTTRHSYTPLITDAECRSEKKQGEVKVFPISVSQAGSGEFNGELVQLKAAVIKTETVSRAESALLLESDQRTFRALVPVPAIAHQFSAGATIKVTGICTVIPFDAVAGYGFRILARGINDLEVLSPPPLWAGAGKEWIAGLSLAALSGIGFAILSHLRVRKQILALNRKEKLMEGQVQQEVAREIASRTQIEHELRLREQQLKESIQERERIGRDLHDGLIQSIYAIGLNIEDCTCALPEAAPEVRTHLGKIKGDLNRVIEEVRNFILGIESSTVTGSEFKTALKSMVLTMSERQRGKARIDVDRRASEELSPEQATQLLHIAREAMTNCLRHADAELVVLSLLRHGSHIRFEVKDNGKGFNVNLPAPRGFGLRNMAARAAEVGATYTLVSEIGGGTRIVLDFEPKKNVSS